MDSERGWLEQLVDVLNRAAEKQPGYGVLLGIILGLLAALVVVVKLQ